MSFPNITPLFSRRASPSWAAAELQCLILHPSRDHETLAWPCLIHATFRDSSLPSSFRSIPIGLWWPSFTKELCLPIESTQRNSPRSRYPRDAHMTQLFFHVLSATPRGTPLPLQQKDKQSHPAWETEGIFTCIHTWDLWIFPVQVAQCQFSFLWPISRMMQLLLPQIHLGFCQLLVKASIILSDSWWENTKKCLFTPAKALIIYQEPPLPKKSQSYLAWWANKFIKNLSDNQHWSYSGEHSCLPRMWPTVCLWEHQWLKAKANCLDSGRNITSVSYTFFMKLYWRGTSLWTVVHSWHNLREGPCKSG